MKAQTEGDYGFVGVQINAIMDCPKCMPKCREGSERARDCAVCGGMGMGNGGNTQFIGGPVCYHIVRSNPPPMDNSS